MESSSCHKIPSSIFVFLLFSMLLTNVYSETVIKESQQKTKTFESRMAQKKMKSIKTQLKNINKPFVKSIKSPDGDIIDCVLFHLQPAFDLPQLRGTISLDLPEIPSGNQTTEMTSEIKQLWNSNGESCPNGTIPIRRTSASDILRFAKFNKKTSTQSKSVLGDEHAMGYVQGDEYYGAQAKLNVWATNVTNNDEFSLSQIGVVAIDELNQETNVVEAGWMVFQHLYRDKSPRLFIYWTNDRSHNGCFNLLCSGFVQTTNKLSLGATIKPISTYNGDQYDFTILIWKNIKSGDWWLRFGKIIMGYWPSSLFTKLQDKANSVQFGGEVFNSRASGQHTTTQMGSGHFPNEGFKHASYIKSLAIIDGENKYSPLSDVSVNANQPNCYGVTKGHSNDWGAYIYYGGPGKNPKANRIKTFLLDYISFLLMLKIFKIQLLLFL